MNGQKKSELKLTGYFLLLFCTKNKLMKSFKFAGIVIFITDLLQLVKFSILCKNGSKDQLTWMSREGVKIKNNISLVKTFKKNPE